MTYDDSPSSGENAKERDPSAMSGRFNEQEALADRIAKASPAAKEQVRMQQELAAQRSEQEAKDQKRSHGFRVQKVKIDLLTKYIQEQSLRPDSLKQDPSEDLKIIDEQAERMVSDREAFYQRQIQIQADKNINLILDRDQQQQSQAPSLTQQFEHDRD